MCGRYSQSKIKKELEKDLGAVADEPIDPSYNIAPTQYAPVVTQKAPARINRFRWGLVPSWADTPAVGAKMINARLESIEEKPAYAPLLENQRCIIPSDGYYEWKRMGKTIIPYRISLPDNGLFCFAGLYDEWKGKDGQPMHTFTVITLPAAPGLAHIHERMPAILPLGKEKLWLSGQISPKALLQLLQPFPVEALRAYTVTDAVNSAQNNGADLWQEKLYNQPGKQSDLFG